MLEHVSIILTFYSQVVFHCMDIQFVYPPLVEGHLGHFQFLAITYKTTMNTCVQVFVRTYVFLSLVEMNKAMHFLFIPNNLQDILFFIKGVGVGKVQNRTAYRAHYHSRFLSEV